MATTIASNTYTVEIRETFFLDGVKRGSKVITRNLSCGEITTRLMSIDAGSGGTIIANFAAAAGIGQYNKDTFKYLRITNLDSANNLVLHLEESDNSHDTELIVLPLNSFMLSSLIIDNEADIDDTAFIDFIDRITGQSAHASEDVDIELVIVTT